MSNRSHKEIYTRNMCVSVLRQNLDYEEVIVRCVHSNAIAEHCSTYFHKTFSDRALSNITCHEKEQALPISMLIWTDYIRSKLQVS